MTTEEPGKLTVQKAEFIDDIEAFMRGKAAEPVIQGIEEQRRKFKLIEQQFVQRKARLLLKHPEIQKALDTVNLLIEKEEEGEVVMDYELAEGVYAKTKIAGVKTVNLWLGAGIMAEYSLQDAKELLEKNLEICKTNIASVDGDIELIRDNVTTLEVSLSRVWNFDVERRRMEREKEAKEGSKE